jgi:uncharacterized protein (TIGR02453 family)
MEMTQAKFAGFPPELFEFMSELAQNNDRKWFQANKTRYRKVVVEPMGQFIEAMAPRLAGVSPHFIADPRPNGGSMFRIYRDTRFSKDKRPYKEHIGCQFRHTHGRDVHAPGFYVHLEPGRVFFGGGIWKPDGNSLAKIRSAIVDNPSAWGSATTNKTFRRSFGHIQGESLQRAPRGYSPDHPLIKDIKLKSFFVLQEAEPALAFGPRFVSTVEKAFVEASPFMSFLAFALDLPYSRV